MLNLYFASSQNSSKKPAGQRVDSQQQKKNDQAASAQSEQQQLTQVKGGTASQILQIKGTLEQMVSYVQKNSTQSMAARKSQLAMLKKLQENNQQLETALQAGQSKNLGYGRLVSTAEIKLVSSMIEDLTHPMNEVAKSAEEKLEQLGLSKVDIEKLQKALKEQKLGAPKFAGGTPKNPIEEALRKIIENNSKQDIINAGTGHQVEAVKALAEPLFAAATWPVLDTYTNKIIYLSALPGGVRYQWA